jgi:hypothetical protein
MERKEINMLRGIVHQVGFIYKTFLHNFPRYLGSRDSFEYEEQSVATKPKEFDNLRHFTFSEEISYLELLKLHLAWSIILPGTDTLCRNGMPGYIIEAADPFLFARQSKENTTQILQYILLPTNAHIILIYISTYLFATCFDWSPS